MDPWNHEQHLKMMYVLMILIQGTVSSRLAPSHYLKQIHSQRPSDACCINLGQHWLRWWLVAWRHQAITWSHVEFSPSEVWGIHQRVLKQQFCIMILKSIFLKLLPYLPGANELTGSAELDPNEQCIFCVNSLSYFITDRQHVSQNTEDSNKPSFSVLQFLPFFRI